MEGKRWQGTNGEPQAHVQVVNERREGGGWGKAIWRREGERRD